MSLLSKFQTAHPRWSRLISSHRNLVHDSADISTTPIECYACTQAGTPAFHSASCDRAHAHAPEYEAGAGSSLFPIQGSGFLPIPAALRHPPTKVFGRVLDPRSKRVLRWNRWILLARGVSLAIDPLFFYAFSLGRGGAPCLYMDGRLAVAVTMMRSLADAVHLVHVWLQFRVAYVSKESLVVGCGKLVWDAKMIARHYVHSVKGFWLDVFVILPVPQVVFWIVVPKLIKGEETKKIMTILLMVFLFQFLPKVYHSICVMRRVQKVTGYIFGTIWWGFALNLIAYFIASHVPLFQNLDDLILDNICDRVNPLVFSKDEKVIREGDPVHRMVFIIRGQLRSSQSLSRGMVATCILGPGNFLGDELLSWCLRRPFMDRLPASSATFECVEATEAFGLDAHHLRYITEHFRYKFASERLKRTARYYSSNWRTWAAVNIQLAWRRYKTRTRGTMIQPEASDNERFLRHYAAMFMSFRPQDHLD